MSPSPPTPLSGIKVVEFAGLAPGPCCGLFLADWGASVTRIDRADQKISEDILARGKRSIAVNLKAKAGVEIAKKLVAQADVLIDPFRPGVLEKLGLGPDVFLGEKGLNRKLVYTRIVGFSPRGHHKNMAGHELNYLAISGILSILPLSSPDGRPSFPLNILADFAGGGLTAATGVLLAILERHSSGLGQIVETDMVSGARYVTSFPIIHKVLQTPVFENPTGKNLLDGGAPYYWVYRCKDGGWFTVGALESQFYAIFLSHFLATLPATFTVATLKASPSWRPTPQKQFDRDEWDDMRAFFAAGFLTKTRDEWTAVFDGTDACAFPVLSIAEASEHTTTASSIPQPHPQLSRTPAPSSIPGTEASAKLSESFIVVPGAHTKEILRELGISETVQGNLVREGTVGASKSRGAAKL